MWSVALRKVRRSMTCNFDKMHGRDQSLEVHEVHSKTVLCEHGMMNAHEQAAIMNDFILSGVWERPVEEQGNQHDMATEQMHKRPVIEITDEPSNSRDAEMGIEQTLSNLRGGCPEDYSIEVGSSFFPPLATPESMVVNADMCCKRDDFCDWFEVEQNAVMEDFMAYLSLGDWEGSRTSEEKNPKWLREELQIDGQMGLVGPCVPLAVPDLRGGAGGSNSTRKRRETKELFEKIKDAVTEANMEAVHKANLRKLLEELEGLFFQPAEQPQTFYQWNESKMREKEEQKKGKGKGKSKSSDLPRYDLSREFPRAEIVSWQSVQAALEKAEEPGVAICKSANHVLELQEMAATIGIQRQMILVAKYDEDCTPMAAQTTMMPYLGNIAMAKAYVCTLNGEKANWKEQTLKEVTLTGRKVEDEVVVRVIAVLHYVEKSCHDVLYKTPDFSLKLAGLDISECRTNKWESICGTITGYATIQKGKVEDVIGKSGQKGIFFSRLAQDLKEKPEVTWIEKKEAEDNLVYLHRVQELAKKENVAMCWRRGGRNDLGIQKPEEDKRRSFAVWGVPGHVGPECLSLWLQEQGWTLDYKPTEPRNRGAPWRIFGVCKELTMFFKVDMDGKERHISIVPWKAGKKPNETAERIWTEMV